MLSCKLTKESEIEIAQTDEHCFTTTDYFFHGQYGLVVVSPGKIKIHMVEWIVSPLEWAVGIFSHSLWSFYIVFWIF